MQEGDYIDAKTVLQMTVHEFNNFRSYLKFLGYRVLPEAGEYSGAKTYASIFGCGFISITKDHIIRWSATLSDTKEQISLEEALRMAKLGELMAQQE